MKKLILIIHSILTITIMTFAQDLQTDTIITNRGDLVIHFVKHASLFFEFDGKITHIDPVSGMGNYENYPDADLILITHHHSDHLDLNAINLIKKNNTKIILTEKCHEMTEDLADAIVMKNDDILNINQIEIKAIPAYNLIHKRDSGQPFHIKGEGNGYVLSFGNKNVLIAGDTENIPEIKALQHIDIAFLPMNLPYTMTPEMVADAAKAFPESLYMVSS